MKRIITTIICILLSLYGLEVYAQKTSIQESDRNTMGTITSREFSIRVDETASYADFSVKVPEGGDYYVSFWLLPAQLPNHSYTEFKVYVNGERVGVIHPSKSNWQNASLDDDQTISLKPGENTITLSTALPDVVSTELVSIAKTAQCARISEAGYQDYLRKIALVESGKMTSQEIIAQEESEYLAQYGDAAMQPLAEDGSQWDITLFHRIPVKYSFYKMRHYEEGDELRIITNSRDPHVTDVFYIGDYASLSRYNPSYQHLSWLVPSSLSSNKAQQFYISIKTIRIPRKGYYTIKARSLINEKLGSINVYIGNEYFDNQALFTAHKSLTMPTDGQEHILMARRQNNSDPILYVEGAGSCPGRIVAYNDDKRPFIGADTIINYMFPSHTFDAVIKAEYKMSTCGFHVQNWSSSSSSQSDFCNVVYFKAKPQYLIYPPISYESATYNVPIALSVTVRHEMGTLQIKANKELSSLYVYDKMGVLVGSKAIEAKQATIPTNELGISSRDLYSIVFYGKDGEVYSAKILL